MTDKTLLLVDDEDWILTSLGMGLEQEGYQVTTADSGETAVEILEDSQFDIVITDLVMKRINGIEVLKRVKSDNPESVVIILTGIGGMASAIDALRYDADDYILKPCALEDLLFRIDKCFDKIAYQAWCRQTKTALEVSENRFERFMDHLPGAAYMKNTEFRFIYANKYLRKHYGDGGSVIPHFPSADPEKGDRDDRCAMNDGFLETEETLTDINGNHRVLQSFRFRILHADRPPMLGGLALDVTELAAVREALKKARRDLEKRIEQRTRELKQANQKLKAEIEERKQTEEALRKTSERAAEQSRDLREVNTALNVLLSKRETDRREIEEQILANVKELIDPDLKRLLKSGISAAQKEVVRNIEINLGSIVSPFIHKLSSKFLDFTPMELQVASLVRKGKRNKEISDLMGLSINTILTHRHNIRQKLGITHTKKNLRTHLISLEDS